MDGQHAGAVAASAGVGARGDGRQPVDCQRASAPAAAGQLQRHGAGLPAGPDRPCPDRGPGRPRARGDGHQPGRPGPELRRTQPARQPPGPSPDRTRCALRRPGRAVPAAQHRAADRPAGRAQGRGCLCAGGPDLPARAHRLPAGRQFTRAGAGRFGRRWLARRAATAGPRSARQLACNRQQP